MGDGRTPRPGTVRIIETGRLELATGNVAADFVNHRSATETLAARGRGPAALQATATWLRTAFTELRFEVQEVPPGGRSGHRLGHAARQAHRSVRRLRPGRLNYRRLPPDRTNVRHPPGALVPDRRQCDRRTRHGTRRPRHGAPGGLGAAHPRVRGASRACPAPRACARSASGFGTVRQLVAELKDDPVGRRSAATAATAPLHRTPEADPSTSATNGKPSRPSSFRGELDAAGPGHLQMARKAGLRSSLSPPLIVDGSTVAAMNLYSFAGPDVFDEQVRRRCWVFGSLAPVHCGWRSGALPINRRWISWRRRWRHGLSSIRRWAW
jgi:hypothetical protein